MQNLAILSRIVSAFKKGCVDPILFIIWPPAEEALIIGFIHSFFWARGLTPGLGRLQRVSAALGHPQGMPHWLPPKTRHTPRPWPTLRRTLRTFRPQPVPRRISHLKLEPTHVSLLPLTTRPISWPRPATRATYGASSSRRSAQRCAVVPPVTTVVVDNGISELANKESEELFLGQQSTTRVKVGRSESLIIVYLLNPS